MRKKRAVGLLLALVLAVGLTPPLRAAELAFVAVNDTIPTTLSGGGMPFHLGGSLYLPYTAFNQQSLGVFVSYRGDEGIISIIGAPEQLTFDLRQSTVTDKRGNVEDVTLMVSGGQIFLPVPVFAGAFGVSISELTSRSGYSVIRMTNGNQVYDDALFLEKAENLISYRVDQYLAPNTPPPQPAVKPTAPMPSAPVQVGQEDETDEEEEEEEEPDPATVYLAVSGLAGAEEALDALSAGGQTAAFFFAAGEIEGNGALLRRIAAAGHVLGLRVPAGAEPKAALRRANDALDRAVHEKTLLALLPETAAGEGIEAAYSVHYLSETPLTAAEAAEASGQTRLLVLEGQAVREGLAILREGEAILRPLRETTSLPEPDAEE